MHRLVLVFIFFGSAIALPPPPQRIVGGENTPISEYPFMASLHMNWWGSIWMLACGGSLVTNSIVLTAAHCVQNDSPSSWRAQLGSASNAMGSGFIHSIDLIMTHEGFRQDHLNHDIALLRLTWPAILGPEVQPALIAGHDYKLPNSTLLSAVGWGNLWFLGPQPENLQRAQVYTIDRDICAKRYAYLKTLPNFHHWPDVTEAMTCTGVLDKGGRGACHGDSGGPMVHSKNVITGVISWGYDCAHEVYPTVNADVSYHVDWIVEKARLISEKVAIKNL